MKPKCLSLLYDYEKLPNELLTKFKPILIYYRNILNYYLENNLNLDNFKIENVFIFKNLINQLSVFNNLIINKKLILSFKKQKENKFLGNFNQNIEINSPNENLLCSKDNLKCNLNIIPNFSFLFDDSINSLENIIIETNNINDKDYDIFNNIDNLDNDIINM